MNAATANRTPAQTAHATVPMDRTPEQWRTLAAAEREARAESWERSDSDGFLTQRAAQKMEHRYLDAATVAEEGWTVETTALFDLDGNVLTVDRREGDYGSYWFVASREGKARFVTESAAQAYKTARRNNEKKGVRLGLVRIAATWNDRTALVDFDGRDLSNVTETVTADLYQDRIDAGSNNDQEEYERATGRR